MNFDSDVLTQKLQERKVDELRDIVSPVVPAQAALRLSQVEIAVLGEAYYRLGMFSLLCELYLAFTKEHSLGVSHALSQSFIRAWAALFIESPDQARQYVAAYNPRIVSILHLLEAHFEGDNVAVEEILASFRIKNEPDFISLFSTLSLFSIDAKVLLKQARKHKFGLDSSPARWALQANPAPPADAAQKYVFVGGAPRSGTTALGTQIARSTKIGMFVELYSPYLGYTPSMFSPAALSSKHFQRSVHQIPNQGALQKLEDGGVELLGDKRPLFLNSWSITRDHFEPGNIRIINILRDTDEIIESYNKRRDKALNLRDVWAPERSGAIAELDLKRQLRVIDDIQKSEFADSMLLVKYPDVLLDLSAAKAVFDFLGVDLTTEENAELQGAVKFNRSRWEKRASAKAKKPAYRFLSPSEIDRYEQLMDRIDNDSH